MVNGACGRCSSLVVREGNELGPCPDFQGAIWNQRRLLQQRMTPKNYPRWFPLRGPLGSFPHALLSTSKPIIQEDMIWQFEGRAGLPLLECGRLGLPMKRWLFGF